MHTQLLSQEVMKRVFHIKFGQDRGTGFIVELLEEKYLVTARHMLKKLNFPKETDFEIGKKAGSLWETVHAHIYYHTNVSIDVAIIKTDYFDQMHFHPINYSSNQLLLSQDLFFLGFPYGFRNNKFAESGQYPFPIVKRGTYSGDIQENNVNALICDWSGNEGFSGGPVIYYSHEDGNEPTAFIAGIIASGHRNDIPVYKNNKQTTEYFTNEATGLEFVYFIEDALEIINNIK